MNVPVDKRRKIAVRKMVAPQQATTRSRQVLAVVNSAPGDAVTVASSDGGSTTGGMEFNSREDVEMLLDEKMKGKNKSDYKGKCEQMIEYIRKLRTCIRWYMQLEDGYIVEVEKLKSTIESTEKKHSGIESQMMKKLEEANSQIDRLHKDYLSLQDTLRKEEDEKRLALDSFEKEAKDRVNLENEHATLLEELERMEQDAKRMKDQQSLLQENNRRLLEYNNSLQQYNSNLQMDATKNSEGILKLQKEKTALMDSLTSFREQINLVKNELDKSRSVQQDAVKQKEDLNREIVCLRNELQQVRSDRDNQLAQVQTLTFENSKFRDQAGKQLKDLDSIMSKTSSLEETCSSQTVEIQTLMHQLALANEKMKQAGLRATVTLTENEEQKKKMRELENRLADAEVQIMEGEKLRKKLHNTILELKGNIRVLCRVRPTQPDGDCNSMEWPVVSFPSSTELLGRGIDLMHNAQKYSFTFDKVLNHEATQGDVFVEISQLVQSALDGYKVCIFAYGQTGSGKTYTMMGKHEVDQKGLIPRSLEQIFQASQSLSSQGWKYKMQASMLEIYNETIRDLLSPVRLGIGDLNVSSKQYTIKHDSQGNTHVSDLTIVDVCTTKEVSSLLQQAEQSRSVSRTQMNEQSSRSHFVFTLRISGVNESTDQQVQGILNLIDLAGSERLNKSGSTGDRLKETQAINKSLSALSDVISSIAKKDDHIPFRNSKLTFLLQPCLGGDSKTLMFVNLSPEPSSAGESLCSLRFAARVNSCEIGIPRRHIQARLSDPRLSCG